MSNNYHINQYNNCYLRKFLNIYIKSLVYIKFHISNNIIENYKINLASLIDKYNKTIKVLEIYINLSLSVYNQILNLNINYVNFNTIILDNYNFNINRETCQIIKLLKNNIIELNEKSSYITNILPKFKSPELIEQEIYNELKNKYKL